MGPFTQVKSAKNMVKSKTKSISNLGAFSNFSKTERSSKFLHETDWSGSYLFCYGAWAQKESAKLQSMRACTDKLVYPVWNLSDSSKKLDDRQIKRFRRCRQSRFLFPDLSRKDRSDSASRVPHELTCQILTIQSLSAIVWENRAEATDRGQPIPFIFRLFSTFIETGWMAVFLNFISF